MRILNLDNRVIDLALEGKLTEGHCRSLVSVDDPGLNFRNRIAFLVVLYLAQFRLSEFFQSLLLV